MNKKTKKKVKDTKDAKDAKDAKEEEENMEHSVKINNAKIFRKPVYYINNNGEKITFISAKNAYDLTGIDNSSILKSCKSNTMLAGGIKWYYDK